MQVEEKRSTQFGNRPGNLIYRQLIRKTVWKMINARILKKVHDVHVKLSYTLFGNIVYK